MTKIKLGLCTKAAVCENAACHHRTAHEMHKANGCLRKSPCHYPPFYKDVVCRVTKDPAVLLAWHIAELARLEREKGTLYASVADVINRMQVQLSTIAGLEEKIKRAKARKGRKP